MIHLDPELMRRLAKHGDQPEPLFEVKTCEECGQQFPKPEGRAGKDFARQRYCGRSCAGRANRRKAGRTVQPSKACEACGATFTKRPKSSYKDWEAKRFCSNRCARKIVRNLPPPKPKPSKTCEHCGAVFYKRTKQTHAQFDAQRYCSRTCGGRAIRSGNAVPRTHCRKGLHELSGDNVRFDARGGRRCKACEAEWERGRPSRPHRPRPRPRPKPAPKPRPVQQQPQRPIWRPASFPPVPNARRPA